MSAQPIANGPEEPLIQLSGPDTSRKGSTEPIARASPMDKQGVEAAARIGDYASGNYAIDRSSLNSTDKHGRGTEEGGTGVCAPRGNFAQGSTRSLEEQRPNRSQAHDHINEMAEWGGQSYDLQIEVGKTELYDDPTPRTPRFSSSPSRAPDNDIGTEQDGGPTTEIQSIMEQFQDASSNEDDESNPRLVTEAKHSMGIPVKYPPRRSSLEPVQDPAPQPENGPTLAIETATALTQAQDARSSPSRPKSGSAFAAVRTSSPPQSTRFGSIDSSKSPSSRSTVSLPKELPPAPDPDPDLPFDFHRFLEQLRHRTADPVAKYLRSFLTEFGKKQWMAHEQVKFISDFLTFIANKMALCEVWRGVSDAEFDNAKEGMEKLVMNRLYSQTFSPAIPPPAPLTATRGKKKITERLHGPGRRGQHQEDIERDDILSQKIRIYGWVEEQHLDITPVGGKGRRLLDLAQQELIKIKTYRAPRDKVICVLNCCKVIFGLLRNSKSSDTSADAFVPLLIYVVLHANPEHLVSNVQYILRFRNQEKLGGEAGYYLSSLMGTIQFIENLDRTSLTVSDDEFERNVEAAVSAMAERRHELTPQPPRPQVQISEKSGLSQPEVVPRNSIETEYSTPARSISSYSAAENILGRDRAEDNTAVNGLLRTIQRPLAGLGRIFSEDSGNTAQSISQGPAAPPQPPRRLSPAVFQPPRHSDDLEPSDDEIRISAQASHGPSERAKAEDAAARQASAEAAEAQRIQGAEHHNVVETLAGMFPNLDKDVIDDVVRVKQGR
ncbi:MAG: hypothetical protein Q9217_006482 [Psora testacea]